MQLVGILPVSGVNVGLALYPPVLAAQISGIQLDITNLGLTMAKKLALVTPAATLSLPTFVASLQGAVAGLTATISDPSKWITANLQLTPLLGVQIGLLDVAIGIAASAQGTLEAGLSAGGLSLYSYAGAASFMAGTSTSVRGTRGKNVNALLIATESPASWTALSEGLYVGDPTPGRWHFDGSLNAGELNTGAYTAYLDISKWLLRLRGARATLAARLNMALGLDLPPFPDLLLRMKAKLSAPEVLLQAALLIDLSVGLRIPIVAARVGALIDLSASLGLSLAAGGLAVWVYSGPGEGLAEDIASTVVGGLPGGSGPAATVYGLCAVFDSPDVWSSIGSILVTG